MEVGNDSAWDRRTILKMAGASSLGGAALSQVGAAEENPEVVVQFRDQTSDGTAIVIDSLYTEVEAAVIIFHSEGIRQRYRVLEVEAEAEFSDRTVELDNPIPETQQISISVQPPEGGQSYGGARATVTVDESAEDPERADPTIELIEADPDAGFHYPYFLFTPDIPRDTERPIFVQPNNSSTTTDDYDEHLENAEDTIQWAGPHFSKYFKSPALVPAFPRYRNEPVSWQVMIQSLDPNVLEIEEPPLERIDRQLLNMIEDATERLEADGHEIADRIHMNGFSQSATFTNRFTILHPEKVSTVTTGGNGFTVLPKEEHEGQTLPYPAGVANLEDLIGKEFNLDAWKEVDQYIYIGDEDQPLPETDSRSYRGFETLGDDLNDLMIDTFGKNRVTERFPVTQSVYEDVGASAEFRIYEGVGHEVNAEIQEDLREFHRAHLAAPQLEISVDRSADEIETGDTVTFFVEVENLTNFDTTVTLALTAENEGETIETMDLPIGPDGTESLELDYTFMDAGEYTLNIDEDQVGSTLSVVDSGPAEDGDAEGEGEGDTGSEDDSEQDAGSVSDQTESTDNEAPGFGIVQVIASVGGIAYLLRNRVADSEQ